MKKTIWMSALCLAAGMNLAAATVEGKVFLDDNGNGEPDAGESGLPGFLVSDGVSFARTDAAGHYELEVRDGQKSVYVHQPRAYRADRWFYRLPAEQTALNFAMRPAGPFRGMFLQVADSETEEFDSWLPNLKALVKAVGPDFIVHTGDLCRIDGIKAHAANFTSEKVGVPVYITVGNHDIIAPVDGKDYSSFLDPYYYSFEWGPYLVVAAPMNYGDVELPYDLADFGDYLQKLFQVIPDNKPLIVLGHELLASGGKKRIAGHDGLQVDLNEHNFKAWVYGHWHNNIVNKHADGSASYCTGLPNKGGIDHSPVCSRMMTAGEDGRLASYLIWGGFADHLSIAVPGENMIPAGRQELPISVAAYNSGAPVIAVKAVLGSDDQVLGSVVLRSENGLVWSGSLPVPPAAAGKTFQLKVVASRVDGEEFEQTKSFVWSPPAAVKTPVTGEWNNLLGNAMHSGYRPDSAIPAVQLQWLQQMPGENFMVSPILAGGKVFAGCMDDGDAGRGGIYAYDAAGGEELWHFTTGYSVKNSIACGEGLVFAQDARGNVYALRMADGTLAWKADSPTDGLPAVAGGVTYADGVLYAGQRRSLAAYEAASGKALWHNTAWDEGESTVNTLSVGDGVLITSANWRALYGMDAATGELLWQHRDDDTRFQSAPAVFHDGKAYAKGYRQLLEIEPRSGEILRSKELPADLQSATAPVVVGGLVLVGTADHGLMAVDLATFDVRWQCEEIQPALLDTAPYHWRSRTVESSPVVLGDTVWIGASDGFLYALELQTGQVKQKIDLGVPVLSSVAAGNGWLFAADFGGRLFGFRAAAE